MRIDSGDTQLLASQRRSESNAGTGATGASSFSSVLAEKLQQTTGSLATSHESVQAEPLDFTNMTASTLFETVNGLIRSGQLDLDDTTSLVGMMSPSSALAKVNYDGAAVAYEDKAVDFFAKIQAGIEGALSRNEKGSAAGLQRAADALARFQGQSVTRIGTGLDAQA
ncbi:hypothetical protein HW090_16200 [Pseudomonas sp. ABC1]|uniref:hypothetical protein n=1 Tax=Pseudomonas sp. ABC1 TaxID=2748080 RepID=UPI0015C3C361|nr:hypothetical protein [Pseudomonas sp. ABC1]QLF94654.1 hypothetical protein HW090_16200 [Pseudomonas sp. ABC1]